MPSAIRRVLLVPSWYPSPDFPISGVFIQDQARVLSEHFDVLVLAQRTYGWRELLRGRSPARDGFVMHDGIRVYEQTVFLPPRPPARLEMAYRLRRARAAVAAISGGWGTPDIIHAHVVLPGGWVAVQFGRALNVPVVLTEHSGPFSMHLGSASRRMFVAKTLRSCSKVLAVSPALARQMQQAEPSLSVDIVGNVIPTRFFRPADNPPAARPEQAPLRLFSVSLLTRQKGYEDLLRAAQMLATDGSRKFELHIGGDGPDRPRLEGLIRRLRLQDRCFLLGMLKREEVRDRMQACDIFVLPSHAETFGVVIGEAMACGKPVLATRCGGAEFQVTAGTGILVKPGDSGALADGIRELDTKRLNYAPAAIREAVTVRFGEAAFLETIARKYHEAASSTVDRVTGAS